MNMCKYDALRCSSGNKKQLLKGWSLSPHDRWQQEKRRTKKADKSENKSSMEMFVENDNDSGKIII